MVSQYIGSIIAGHEVTAVVQLKMASIEYYMEIYLSSAHVILKEFIIHPKLLLYIFSNFIIIILVYELDFLEFYTTNTV